MFDFLDPEAALLDGLSQYKTVTDFETLNVSSENDRWLAASSLQKSLRRGNIREALKAAHVLKHFSDTHLWNRLAVICLEDIGLANLDIVSQMLWVSGKRQWRNKNSGDDLILSYLIYQICGSRKCRSLDDALYVAEYHPLYTPPKPTRLGTPCIAS